MDEVSYYGTLVAMLSLQLSLFWLFKHDQSTRRLTVEEIKVGRLAIVLVSPAQRSTTELRTKLEGLGFLVLEVRFLRNGPSSFAADAVQLNLRHQSPAEQCQRAAQFLAGQLASRDSKLHAYISLPGGADLPASQSAGHDSPIGQLGQLLLDSLLPPYQLLAAFSGPIGADQARVICLHGPRRPGLPRLARLVEQALFKYLGEELGGRNLIEVDIVQDAPARQGGLFEAVRSLSSAISTLTKRLLGPSSAALLGGWLGRDGAGARPLEPEASEDAHLDRATDRTIKDLVLLVHPQQN